MAPSPTTSHGLERDRDPDGAQDGNATGAPRPAGRRSGRMSAALPIVRRMNVLLRATDGLPRTLFPPRADESGLALPVPVLDTSSRARAALSSCATAMILAIALLATAVACCGASALP